jgi:hypothetical protein
VETTAPARVAPRRDGRAAARPDADDATEPVDLHVPRPAWLTRYALVLVGLDALAMAAATLTAKISWLGIDPEPLHIRDFSIPYSALVLVTAPTWLAILGIAGAYDLGPFGTNPRVWSRLVRAGAQLLAVVAVAYYVVHLEQLGRGVLVGMIPLALAFTVIGRVGALFVLDQLRHHGRARRTALLVGHQRAVDTVMHLINARPDAGVEVVGVSLVGTDDDPRRPRNGHTGSADTDDRATAGANGDARSNGRDQGTGQADTNGNITNGERPAPPPVDRAALITRSLTRTGAETVIVSGGLEHGQLQRLAWVLEGTGIVLLVTAAPADMQELTVTRMRPVAGLPLLHLDT